MDKAEGGEAVFTLFHHRNVGIYPFLTVFVTGLFDRETGLERS